MKKLADKVELGLELHLEAVTCTGKNVNFVWADYLDGLSYEVAWEWAAAY